LELDGGLPAEDVDEHLELELIGVDLHDLAREVGERPLPHADALAHLVFEAGLGLLDGGVALALGGEEGLDLAAGQRRGLLTVAASSSRTVASASEPSEVSTASSSASDVSVSSAASGAGVSSSAVDSSVTVVSKSLIGRTTTRRPRRTRSRAGRRRR